MVTQVIVVSNDDTSDSNGVESETIGVAFCQKLLGSTTNWKQTSYNGNMRVRYAGIGFSYNSELDAFVTPQPHASWTLDSGTVLIGCPHWSHAPTLTDEETEAGKYYSWDEDTIQSDNTTGWVLTSPHQLINN